MKFIKASEQLPESTNGFGKQIVTRWSFEHGNSQLRVCTINQFLDLTKSMIDLEKVEWMDVEQSTELFNKESIINAFDNLLEMPDILIDAVQNENTDIDADRLFQISGIKPIN